MKPTLESLEDRCAPSSVLQLPPPASFAQAAQQFQVVAQAIDGIFQNVLQASQGLSNYTTLEADFAAVQLIESQLLALQSQVLNGYPA